MSAESEYKGRQYHPAEPEPDVLCLRRLTENQYARASRAGSASAPRFLRAGEPIPYGIAIALGSALTAGRIDVFQALFV